MKVALLQREKDIAALVERLYQIKGKDAKEISKRASDALLLANPQLGEISDLVEGSPLAVPEVTGAQIINNLDPSAYVDEATIEQVRSGLKTVLGIVETSLKAANDEAKNTIETLKSPDVRKILRADPAMNELSVGIVDHAKSAMKDAETTRATMKEAVASLSKDLEEFRTIFDR